MMSTERGDGRPPDPRCVSELDTSSLLWWVLAAIAVVAAVLIVVSVA